jgi:hypothetical protein
VPTATSVDAGPDLLQSPSTRAGFGRECGAITSAVPDGRSCRQNRGRWTSGNGPQVINTHKRNMLWTNELHEQLLH